MTSCFLFELGVIEVPLYGSSRLGVWRPDREVETTGWELFDTDPMTGTGGGIAGGWERGRVQFELSNYLGNVLVTISDARTAVDDGTYEVFTICHTCLPGIPCVSCFNEYDQQNSTPDGVVDYYLPQVLTANDYYPFGMGMPGRKFAEDESYRYGFNGKEKDNDINSLTAYDYGFRIYNPAIGRFLSVDPLTKEYPWYTPYQFAGNKPIWAKDLDGKEEDISWQTITVEEQVMEMYGPKSLWDRAADGFGNILLRGGEWLVTDELEGRAIRNVLRKHGIDILESEISNKALGSNFQIYKEDRTFKVRPDGGVLNDIIDVLIGGLNVTAIMPSGNNPGYFAIKSSPIVNRTISEVITALKISKRTEEIKTWVDAAKKQPISAHEAEVAAII